MKTSLLSHSQLGRRIRRARQEQGLSQEDLAGGTYTAAYVSHVEHGRRRASQDALTFFAGRLGLTYEQLVSGRNPDDDIRLEVEIRKAVALIHEGRPTDARTALEDVRAAAVRLSSRSAAMRADEAIALSLYRDDRIDEALTAYERLRQELATATVEEQTTAVVGIGRCLFQKGKLHDVVDLLENHRSRLERNSAPDPTALVQVYAAQIGPYIDLGKMDKAKEAAIRGGEISSDVADPEHLACLFINRAAFLLEQKEPRQALVFLARADDIYKQMGWQADAAKVAVARGMVMLDSDDLARAEEMFRSIVDDPAGAVITRDRARALTGLAQVYRRRGVPEDGRRLTEKALKLTHDLPGEAAEARREAGMCARATGDSTGALRHWRKALRLYLDIGDKGEVAKTSRLMGDLLMDLGDAEKAAAAYREGLAAMGDLR